jgi:uncharacterized membrane protein
VVRQSFRWHKSDAQRSSWAASITSKSVRPVILHSSWIYSLVVILCWDQTCAGHMVKKSGLSTVWFITFHYVYCRVFRNLQVTWEWAVFCILMKFSWACWDVFCWWQCEDLTKCFTSQLCKDGYVMFIEHKRWYRVIDFGHLKTSRLNLCSCSCSSPGSSLWTETAGLCVSGVLSSIATWLWWCSF